MNCKNLKIWQQALNDIIDSNYKYVDWSTVSPDTFKQHIYLEFKAAENWFYQWTKNLSNRTINKLIFDVLGDLWN